VAFGGGLFVAVGDNSNTITITEVVVLTSADGINWTPQTLPTSDVFLTGVAYGNGIFVTGGPNHMLASLDGLNWGSVAAGVGLGFNDIVFGNGIFVAVGGSIYASPHFPTSSSAFIKTSPDGLNWTTTRSTSGSGASYPGPLQGIAFGNGMFVAVAQDGQDNVLTSEDGANWTVRVQASFSLKGVAAGTSGFVAVGGFGTLVSSSDGVEWVARSTGVGGGTVFGGPYVPITKVVFANNTFVALGDYGIILTSPDGVAWTSQNSGTTNTLNSVIFENGTFVAVGVNGTILTSPDAVVWTSQNSGTTNPLNSVVFGNGTFVAVGNYTILTSPDGVNWTAQASGIAPYTAWYEVIFRNGLFVAIGGMGGILTSVEGTNWVLNSINWGSGVSGPHGRVTFGNGAFVASPGGGAISTSVDGLNWEFRIDTTAQMVGLAFGNGIFVAVGFKYVSPSIQGMIFTSPDGINWTLQTSASTDGLMPFGVVFENGIFMILGEWTDGRIFTAGLILSSPDGTNWTAGTIGANVDCVAFGNRAFVAVGSKASFAKSGAILQSDPLIFSDVQIGHWAEAHIKSILDAGITTGCSANPSLFCPDTSITRGQMAVFMETSLGQSTPPPCTGNTFSDVHPDTPGGAALCGFIEDFAVRGITGGCQADDPLTTGVNEAKYCPDDPVTRQQMAVFIQAAIGADPAPQCNGTVFGDVDAQTVGDLFCRYIEDFAAQGITGGCAADDPATQDVNEAKYCPFDPVTRAEMAVFLVAAPAPLNP
jgi:hypothetical protein